MEHFLLGSTPVDVGGAGPVVRHTSHYLEAKFLVQQYWLPVYVVRPSDGVGAALTCWNHDFDVILDNLPKPQFEPIMRRLRPTWFACVDNSIREQYGEGAVLELIDPDDMNRKWMIACLFSCTDDDDLEVIGPPMDKILAISARVADEAGAKPSKWDYVRAAAGGAAQGGAQGMAMANRIRAAAQWIPDLSG